MLLLALTMLLACGDKPADSGTDGSDDAVVDSGGATGADGGDTDAGTATDGGDTDGGDTDGGDDLAESYVGPDYAPCISDGQCEPGSACTEVPGHATRYCAPPCTPGGDGSECDLTDGGDMGFDTVCLSNGRCARTCSEDQVASEGDSPGVLVPADGDECPSTLECRATGDDGDDGGSGFLCAGPDRGSSGPYGMCTHPQMDGPDCPDQHSCYGGGYIGLDVGVCLPWCDTGACPTVPDGTSASPLCYDIGLDHPVCALICIPGASTCPVEQECVTIYSSIGLCLPEGAEIPDIP
ncbi:MAG: hypothetical protein H6742_16550 [Alphaproteobacteria bacterium]|nr:hypothetical protein [Alphaproteobacteria bacterium]